MYEAGIHVADCKCLDASLIGGPVTTDPRCVVLVGGPRPDPKPKPKAEMTDREALEQLLARFGLTPHADRGNNWPGPNDVVLTAKHGGVEGYDGFSAWWQFDETGKFVKLDIGE